MASLDISKSIPVVGSVIGFASDIVGGIFSSNAAKKAAEAEAAAYERNALQRIALADEVKYVGEKQAHKAKLEGRFIAASARAGLAGSGTDVNIGTAANMVARLEVMGEINAAAILYESNREAGRLELEAKELFRAAGETREVGEARADAASVASGFRAASSLLGGVGNFMEFRSDIQRQVDQFTAADDTYRAPAWARFLGIG